MDHQWHIHPDDGEERPVVRGADPVWIRPATLPGPPGRLPRRLRGRAGAARALLAYLMLVAAVGWCLYALVAGC